MPPAVVGEILLTQMRLAQIVIVEMLHVSVAPVTMYSTTRLCTVVRRPSVHVEYGNKVPRLAVRLSDDRGAEPAEGEQGGGVDGDGDCDWLRVTFWMGMGMGSWVLVWGGCDRSMYLLQSYLKTVSLIAKGVREVVFLGGVKEGGMGKEVACVMVGI